MPDTIDPGTFWKALGSRAVGTAIVTARDGNGPAGFFALSVSHLSATPPMLMVSIGLQTSALATIRNARHFAVNYLADTDGALVDVFSGKSGLKGADRFEQDRWTALQTGAPVLSDAVGALDCVLDETIERHGAVIALGRLVAYSAGQSRAPLVSFGGGYRRIGDAVS